MFDSLLRRCGVQASSKLLVQIGMGACGELGKNDAFFCIRPQTRGCAGGHCMKVAPKRINVSTVIPCDALAVGMIEHRLLVMKCSRMIEHRLLVKKGSGLRL